MSAATVIPHDGDKPTAAVYRDGLPVLRLSSCTDVNLAMHSDPVAYLRELIAATEALIARLEAQS